MRISDWSSDVCSSDLEGREGDLVALAEQIYFGEELTSSKPLKLYAPSGNVSAVIAGAPVELVVDIHGALSAHATKPPIVGLNPILQWNKRVFMLQQLRKMGLRPAHGEPEADRSEEHTSELQSLMSNSYAVI